MLLPIIGLLLAYTAGRGALLDSQITARVVPQFVVDTTGHAEPNSFRVIDNTDKIHENFVEAAKEAILKWVFRPARLRDRPVRQLVGQAMVFQPYTHRTLSSK